jgi:hypothetical protein
MSPTILPLLLVLGVFVSSCTTPPPKSPSVESDWPQLARTAVYSTTATPSLRSPEGVTRLLEQRWSLADIRTFCIPQRRHNPGYQNLVLFSSEAWKGRLYSDAQTGFDRISWYAAVRDGRVETYSLGVYRGGDYWLLEIGNAETVRTPPRVSPDPSAPHFIGHK